jgi:hypothetical protein
LLIIYMLGSLAVATFSSCHRIAAKVFWQGRLFPLNALPPALLLALILLLLLHACAVSSLRSSATSGRGRKKKKGNFFPKPKKQKNARNGNFV